MSRALRIAAIVWVAAITIRYWDAVVRSLRNPFTPGSDFAWFVLSLGFVAVAVAAVAWHRGAAMGVGVVVLSSVAVVIILRSGAFISSLIALWVLTVSTVFGDWLLTKLGLRTRHNLCDRFVVSFPIGIAAFGLGALILALIGLLNPIVVWIVFLAICVAEFGHAKSLVRDLLSRPHSSEEFFAATPESPFLILLMGFAAARNLTWNVAPELDFDSLNVRLAVPRIFVDQGRFTDLPYVWHSYFVHLLEYFNAICIALHGEAVAKFTIAVVAIAGALSVYSLGRLVFSPAAGLWAAVFFYTTPLVSWGSGTAYNDNAVAEFVAASIVAFILWYRSERIGWIIAAGLLAGGSIAIKANAAYAILAVGLILIAVVIFKKHPIRPLAGFVIPAILIAAPWYLLVYSLTGNPVFPLMNGVFKSTYWEIDNALPRAADFGVGTTPEALMRLPLRLTFETLRFGEALPPGSLGPLLLFVPFGLMRLRANREARILALVMVTYLAIWAWTFQYGAHYLAVLPVVAAFGIGGFLFVGRSFIPRVRKIALGVLLVGQIAVLPVLYWKIPERFPVSVAFGTESRESLLRRVLDGYAATQYLNRVAEPGEKVLAIGHEDLRLYMKPPLETLTESRVGSRIRRTRELSPGRDLAAILAEEGIHYILLNAKDLVNPPSYYPYASREFLQEFATQEYSDATIRIFQLKR